ncbi:hypothetical protein EVA_05255 [gut metagenome]|uniref:Uncharacterized protein n=1 Tax=gut metagenome TaxID=749906 RepID=J9D208_9ZZZZ
MFINKIKGFQDNLTQPVQRFIPADFDISVNIPPSACGIYFH